MNRTILILLVTLCAFAVGCTTEPTLGGYAKVPVTNSEVMAAAEFAINAQSKAIQSLSDGQPRKLELLQILRAEQQVVAGTNYRLTLRVKQNGHERTAEAVVFQALKPTKYELVSWNWK